MLKEKKKRQIIGLSFNPEQRALLQRLMAESHQTHITAFFVYLMAQEEQHRNENTKRSPGRPKKQDVGGIDSEPENILDPGDGVFNLNKGRLISRTHFDMQFPGQTPVYASSEQVAEHKRAQARLLAKPDSVFSEAE